MAGPLNSSLTRVHPFFELALQRSGWIGGLLLAAPAGRQVLGDVLDDPGDMDAKLLEAHPDPAKAPRRMFEFEVAPSKRFLRWLVRNPDELTWPEGQTYSSTTKKWREALLQDKHAGRPAAQDKALRPIEIESATTGGWWRFEGSSWIDAIISTDRLVVTVEGKRTEPLSSSTHWYKARSQLVRNLEAARDLADGRAWGCLLLSENEIPQGTSEALAASLRRRRPTSTTKSATSSPRTTSASSHGGGLATSSASTLHCYRTPPPTSPATRRDPAGPGHTGLDRASG